MFPDAPPMRFTRLSTADAYRRRMLAAGKFAWLEVSSP
jgi:hypothetical protein